jgi:hypothetical protein
MEFRDRMRCNSIHCRNFDFIQIWFQNWAPCNAPLCPCKNRYDIRICGTCFTVQHYCNVCDDIISIAPPKHSHLPYEQYKLSSFKVMVHHMKTRRHINNNMHKEKDAE